MRKLPMASEIGRRFRPWQPSVFSTTDYTLGNHGRMGRLRGPVGSALDHRSLPPEFESRRGQIWRVFHLSLRFITFGGRSAHLAYHVHKSGRKHQSASSSASWPHRAQNTSLLYSRNDDYLPRCTPDSPPPYNIHVESEWLVCLTLALVTSGTYGWWRGGRRFAKHHGNKRFKP